MPGGGREYRDVYEEYEAFPGLYWSFRPQTVEHPDFFRYGGSDDFCFPEAEGLEIIRRCRVFRTHLGLYVPAAKPGLLDDSEELAEVNQGREVTLVDDIDTTVVEITFQRGYSRGWYFAYQGSQGRYPFLGRRNGKVLVITPRRRLRAWGDGPTTATPNVGDEWAVMVNGENVVLRWRGSRWESADPIDVDTVDKIVSHRRG